MKTTLTLLVIVLTQAIWAQNVTIPDPNFKSYLLNNTSINTNGDAEIQVTEAASFSDSITVVAMGIQDLTGIEAFTNLIFLSVVNNQLTSLNVTQNTQLKELICAMNTLTVLDVSQNTLLERLVVAMNPGLASLDITYNVNLRELHCDNTSIASLDLSNQALLENLYCSNASLVSLDVSSCPAIKIVDCEGNSIQSINTTSCTQLVYLSCHGNGISSLDLSTNVALEELHACCNQMTALDVSNLVNLEILDCPFNAYTTMDLSNNPNLQIIYLFFNQLTSLNVASGGNTNISLFWAQNNNLGCIQVDNPTYSTTNWLPTSNQFMFDSTAVFGLDCSLLALPEEGLDKLRMFPNPCENTVTVVGIGNSVWTLYTLSGSVVLEQEIAEGSNSIDVSSLGTGVYFAKVTQNGLSSAVEKLVKL